MKSSRMRAKTDNAKTATKLLVAMTGKASSAKAAASCRLRPSRDSIGQKGRPPRPDHIAFDGSAEWFVARTRPPERIRRPPFGRGTAAAWLALRPA